MKQGDDFRTVVTAREGGSFLVERQLCNITIDRYNTHDLTKPIKRQAKWIDETIALFSQPSAEIVIEVPPIPALELSLEQKFEQAVQLNGTLTASLADIVKKSSAKLFVEVMEQQAVPAPLPVPKIKRKKFAPEVVDCTGGQFCCDNCGHKSAMSPCPICGGQLGGCYGGETLKQFDAKWAKHVELFEGDRRVADQGDTISSALQYGLGTD